MIRFMIDTDQLDQLSGHFELLMTYSDLVTDYAALAAHFPHSKLILIDRGLGDPTGLASVFDIEPGALTIEAAVRRYDEQHAKRVQYLTVYHDRADATAIDHAFNNRNPWHIYATLDGTAHIAGYVPLQGPAAVQCLTAADLGMHADGHLVFEDAWNPTRLPGNLVPLRSAVSEATSSVAGTNHILQKLAALIGG